MAAVELAALTVVHIGLVLAPTVGLLHVIAHDEAVERVVFILVFLRVVFAIGAAAAARASSGLVDPRGGANDGGGELVILVRIGPGLVIVGLWVLTGVVAGGEALEQEADHFLHAGELVEVLARLDRIVDTALASGLEKEARRAVMQAGGGGEIETMTQWRLGSRVAHAR